jgi:hypothetical protein
MTYTPPIPSSFTTKKAPIIRPNLASPVAPAGGGLGWTYGAWVELVAANVLTDHALSYLTLFPQDPNAGAAGLDIGFQLEVGTGAAGSEVARGDWKFDIIGGQATVLTIEAFPLLIIPANARVAVRQANFDGPAPTISVVGAFYPLPL